VPAAPPVHAPPPIPDATFYGKAQRNILLEYWSNKVKTETDPKRISRMKKHISGIINFDRPDANFAAEDYAFLRGTYAASKVEEEVPFKDGRRVEGRPSGHVRPDVVHHDNHIEVKRYKIANISGLIGRAKAQIKKRKDEGLPAHQASRQAIIIDLRGQQVSAADISNLRSRVAQGVGVSPSNIEIVVYPSNVL
jgi:hypothetical protein